MRKESKMSVVRTCIAWLIGAILVEAMSVASVVLGIRMMSSDVISVLACICYVLMIGIIVGVCTFVEIVETYALYRVLHKSKRGDEEHEHT